MDDENAEVRLEAIYALGSIAQAPLRRSAEQLLIKALDHYDPAIRAGAARVAGRLQVKAAADALIKAVNDSHRRRALRGDARARRCCATSAPSSR